ncbi:hypothetical protein JL721_5697 [Aureococcus anophagefferens]|nr:hypothetical protein JL721_5697 [Aureococcus anophagefferens]
MMRVVAALAMLPCAVVAQMGGMEGMGMGSGRRQRDKEPLAVKGDLPCIRCDVCEIVATELWREATKQREAAPLTAASGKPGEKKRKVSAFSGPASTSSSWASATGARRWASGSGTWTSSSPRARRARQRLAGADEEGEGVERELPPGLPRAAGGPIRKWDRESATAKRSCDLLFDDDIGDVEELVVPLWRGDVDEKAFKKLACKELSGRCGKDRKPVNAQGREDFEYDAQDKSLLDTERMMENMAAQGMPMVMQSREDMMEELDEQMEAEGMSREEADAFMDMAKSSAGDDLETVDPADPVDPADAELARRADASGCPGDEADACSGLKNATMGLERLWRTSVAAAPPDDAADDAGSFFVEMWYVVKLGAPMTLSAVFGYLPVVIMLVMVRTVDEPGATGGAGMGVMYQNLLGVSTIIGAGSGLGRFARGRQLVIHGCLLVPVGAAFLVAEPALLALGQPAETAALAGRYCARRCPALPALALLEAVKQYAVAQRVVWVPLVVSCWSCATAVFGLAYAVPAHGFDGAPWAITAADWGAALVMAALAPRLVDRRTWPRWSWRVATERWRELLELSLPAAFMLLTEWWGWEVALLLAGTLCARDRSLDDTLFWPPACPALDAFPICSNTMVISFMCHFGFSIAGGARVGNLVGAGRPRKAKTVAALLCVVVAIATAIVALLLRHADQWVAFYTMDPDVARLAAATLPLVAVYIWCDAIGPGALNKLLANLATVKVPALVNVVAFYGIGLPYGAYRALVAHRGDSGRGLYDLWSGLALGIALMVLGLGTYFYCCVDMRARRPARTVAAGVKSRTANSKYYRRATTTTAATSRASRCP